MWEVRQVSANVSLSGDPPLTVTRSAGGGHSTQASTSFSSSAEVTLRIDGNPSLRETMCVGVMDAQMSWDHSDFLASKAGHWLYVSDGSMWNCARNTDSGSAPLNEGSTITIKVNMLSATVHFFHNGTMVGNPDGLSMMGRLPEALRVVACVSAAGQAVTIAAHAFVVESGVADASSVPDVELTGGVVGDLDAAEEAERVEPSFDPPPLTGEAKQRMEQAEQVQMFTGHELELCLYAIKAGHDNWRGSPEERASMGPVSVAADWIFQVSESHLERVRKQLAGHNVVWGVPEGASVAAAHARDVCARSARQAMRCCMFRISRPSLTHAHTRARARVRSLSLGARSLLLSFPGRRRHSPRMPLHRALRPPSGHAPHRRGVDRPLPDR